MTHAKAMLQSRSILICVLFVSTLSAQQAPSWTLDEATIAAVLPAIVQGSAVPPSGKGNQPLTALGDYSLRTMAAPRTAGTGDVTYAWPRSTQAAAPGGEVKFVPPVLSNAFSRVRGSCVLRGGYLFQVYLPGKTGWVTEAPTGGACGVEVDATRAGSEWCAVAWPWQSGVTGTRAFWINSNGDILATAAGDAFSGRAKRPGPDSAGDSVETPKPSR